ncbi:uncharacterized protein LOC122298707 [Carya illinoinensis]|uniref:uncharacterized protein LOC122298707 n=1 Tax=Carya illinoinensis TaxID=32201 RepID=UPI001C721BEA|nr:uncharacterized protein LOC122298707 [Carya illinoinensis]
MKTLSWNCRELGNPRTVQDLCHMAKEKRPNIVFLMETKINSDRCGRVKRRLKFDGCFTVEPVGRKGGLALMWDCDTYVEVLNYSLRHISAWITVEEGRRKWLLTGFYGEPEVNKREEAWRLLTSLKPEENLGWCVIGDFNEILSQSEKIGGCLRQERLMDSFRGALESGGLFDLGWKGDKYTWSNKHEDNTFIKERLDRVVANIKWSEMFQGNEVEVLAARSSDHKPIMLSTKQVDKRGWKGSRQFRYEASWALEEECKVVLKRAWQNLSQNKMSME